MIKLTDTQSDHVLGVRVEEKLSSRDVALAMDFVNEKIRTRDHIALYVEIDAMSGIESGAVREEMRHLARQVMDLGHVERAAFVTDKQPSNNGRGIAEYIPMIDVKTFSTSERREAQAWAAERKDD